MTVKIFPTFLLPVLTFLTVAGVCPLRHEEIYVNAGEMVVLQCPHYIGQNPSGDTKLFWTSYTPQKMYVIDNKSSAEQRQMLIHGRSLVILTASVNHQGNYSCSLGNASSKFWFGLTIYTKQSAENEKRNKYIVCYTQESCTMMCPKINNPDVNTLNVSSVNDIMWHKEGESLPNNGYFSSVEKKDQGVYTCTRSYLYHGQKYKMSFTIELDVQPKDKPGKTMIISPSTTDVFYVDLGSKMVIDCKAVVYSDFDELFWLSDTSFVELNNSFPVFYTYHTSEDNSKEINITASLVFKKVSQADLSRHYTCKLDSASEPSSFVTITLAPKAHPFRLLLALSIMGILVVIAVIVVYVKFKIHITLFLRDTIGCHKSISDRKNYDAFLMCYESETDAGLNDDNRQWLKSVLEERFGYSICLYDRNIIPGRAEAEAVLDCIEKSRTVVLVPISPDCFLGSDVVNDIYASLVKRQNHLVFIKTETTVVPTSGSLLQALELLGKAVDIVTWKGIRSKTHSSSFFKQLRYYLSAPQHPPKIRLLPQTATQYDMC